MAKHSYPAKRKKARRLRESYWPKAKREAMKVECPKLLSGPVSYEDLQDLDAIQFAEDILGVCFDERPAQRIMLKAFYGLGITDDELPLYTALTTNDEAFEPYVEKREACWSLGARSGKSFLSSIIALYESTRQRWRQYVNPGEANYTVIIGTRMQQAQDIIGRNCARMIADSRIRHLVEESWATVLRLTNGAVISSYPASSTAARGLAISTLIFDEVAHFMSGDSPKADHLIYDSLLPRTAQFPGAKILMISTPASQSGLFWDIFDEGFQVSGRLTCQAPTKLVNLTIPLEFIEREHLRDPDNAARELDAEFAMQVDAYLGSDKIAEALILPADNLPDPRFIYSMGVDQSGLAGKDKFAVAVSHRDGTTVVVDVLRSWQTSSGKTIMGEISQIAKDYHIHQVLVDRYASGWVAEAFNDIGLEVEYRPQLPVVYANFKSLLLAGRLELPNTKDLRDGLIKTQAYFGRNNSMSIAHPRDSSGHGDAADAVATSVFASSSKPSGGFFATALEYQRKLARRRNGRQEQYSTL